MSTVPINPRVLAWARSHRKLSLDAAADLLEISTDELRDYESGPEAPSISLLRKMAKEYDLPVASLLMPKPLPRTPPLKDFRTFEGADATITHKTSVIIDYVRSHVDGISDLLKESPDLYPLKKTSGHQIQQE